MLILVIVSQYYLPSDSGFIIYVSVIVSFAPVCALLIYTHRRTRTNAG